MLALALAAALGRLPLAGAGTERPALTTLAALTLVAVLVGAVVSGWLVPAALLLLVAELAVRTIAHRVSPGIAIAEAAGLLALGELLWWVRGLSWNAQLEPAVAAWRIAGVLGAAALAAAVALLTLLVAST